MNSNPIAVLVVDDSALMRNLIGKMVESSPDLILVGKAMNGDFALKKIPSLKPDIIVLDLEMPEMNGIDFLRERKRLNIDIPVLILSSIAKKGAEITMEAINLGACDFMLKPNAADEGGLQKVQEDLVNLLRGYGRQYREAHAERPAVERVIPERPQSAAVLRPVIPLRESSFPRLTPLRSFLRADVITIGISTGGPNALRKVFAELSPDLGVPIVVVQHMPAGFTEEFAKSLDRLCPLDVKEAQDGDLLKPNRVLIAPGNKHMSVEKRALAAIVRLSESALVNGHRPSADVLFESVAKNYQNNCLAVIMTGMGKDGAHELGSIYREGGMTIAQNESSCVVYGMPKAAVDAGYVHHVVSLDDMAKTINELVKTGR